MAKVIESSDGCQLVKFCGDLESARKFAAWVRKCSSKRYREIDPDHWYCRAKDTHIKIEAEK